MTPEKKTEKEREKEIQEKKNRIIKNLHKNKQMRMNDPI